MFETKEEPDVTDEAFKDVFLLLKKDLVLSIANSNVKDEINKRFTYDERNKR